MNKIPCTVEILTRNSSATLGRCLESVKDFAEIIVLDGNSTDSTPNIARQYVCRIYKQYETNVPNVSIKDYSEVRNRGLKLATYDWFMYIDSDEYLSPEAAEEIRAIAESANPPSWVFWQPRKYVLEGNIIDCATTYPNQQLRFFHRDYVEKFDKPIHEKIVLKAGVRAGFLKCFEYVPLEPVAQLHRRWERYMRMELAMNEGKPAKWFFRRAFRHIALFGLYSLRYLKNIFYCRGTKLPLRYEWARHQYEFKLAGLLFLEGIKKL